MQRSSSLTLLKIEPQYDVERSDIKTINNKLISLHGNKFQLKAFIELKKAKYKTI
jgi:hypothetical protein